ncbi:YebG family protein [Marinomonas sp. M1K-6]|uniref:YebG family protein n=1 Tax=Marinomonas profundi TaxID=2726122 RepID=A0A847R6I4_9GAMM|nr:YebG family protein [Marinomonas profundi]NLQ17696.1 YebG family protein [Marinomonas profundi]UDV04255.1 YebG family protein [Marinomonas profundi]
MPVIIKYVVERDGIEKMTFTSKAQADVYDKLLDTAEALYDILDQSQLANDRSQKEALSMYLAEHKDLLLEVLSNKKKTTPKSKKSATKTAQLDLTESSPKKPLEDLVIEPDEDVLYEEEESNVVFDDDSSEFAESDAA